MKKLPSRIDCLGTLGLEPGASNRQITQAYRRLALKYHPDRAFASIGLSATARRRMFERVSNAYHQLEAHTSSLPRGAGLESCSRCHDVEPLLPGIDGNAYCHTCLTSARGKRALPPPPIELMHCAWPALGVAVSAVLMMAWLHTHWPPYWGLSVASCAIAMALLLAISLQCQYASPSGSHRIGPARGRHRRRRRWLEAN